MQIILIVQKVKKKILLTIDDAFLSFYEVAWPYLKKNKIPFILFVSTEPIGKFGYMNWSQIKEMKKYRALWKLAKIWGSAKCKIYKNALGIINIQLILTVLGETYISGRFILRKSYTAL